MWFVLFSFFFFNDTATTEIYTLSLHDALPISLPVMGSASCRVSRARSRPSFQLPGLRGCMARAPVCCEEIDGVGNRSEEHTSELQSHLNLVCRLLLEKKKTI